MGAWRRLGKAIGARMPFIVPLCVTAGVLFPGVFGPIETVVPFLFAFMTFQGSLNNTFRQLAETVRHPLPLLVILGVTLVFMPVVAFGMASILFAGDTQIITGVLLEYSVPIGIVSFMWVGMFSGNTALGSAPSSSRRCSRRSPSRSHSASSWARPSRWTPSA